MSTAELPSSASDVGVGSAEQSAGGELRHNQLGLVELLFQSLASAAPGLSVTLAVIIGAEFAGASLSFSLVLALIGIMLVAACIGQMAKEFPSAGGFYTFVSRGLHPALGPVVAWLYLIVWVVFPSTLFLPFGNFLASTLRSDFGWPFTSVWIILALVCIAMIYAFVYNGAKVSTNVSVALGSIEIAILAVLSIWLIVKAGSRNTLSVFGTAEANVKGFVGASGIIGAMVFAIYGFVGFENVVPMAEEAKNPRRNVARATVLAPFILGLFIIFCTYASTVYFGVGRFASFPAYNGGNAWIGIGKDVWSGGWYVLLFALLNSCLGSANGATNAAIRHMFAMGRIRLLPPAFARVEDRHGTPIVALVVLTAISVCVTLAAGLGTGSPLEGFAFLGTIETASAILLYLLVAISCLAWFLRHRPASFNPFLHVVVPVLAIVVMVPALMAAVGIGSSIFSFITPLSYPLDLAGYIALAWLIAGVAYAVYIWTKHPDRARATEVIFIKESDSGQVVEAVRAG
jgi:amino acid transporter